MKASLADLIGALAIADDSASDTSLFDEETGEQLDASILDEGRQGVELEVFEEFEYREDCLGEAYPFVVDYNASTISFRGVDSLEKPAQLIYVFCLLSSAIRTKMIEADQADTEALKSLERLIGRLFQACSCLAAGAYLVGSVASFGFPRSEGTAFLPALRSVYERFGSGEVRQNQDDVIEDLTASLKDGGIDVIAWRDLPDRMPGKIYMLGQCASGLNWRGKSVTEYIQQLHGAWFTIQPATHSIPAMFIPFPFHHDLDQDEGRTYKWKIRTQYWYEEMRYGIIFDRLRITHLISIFEGMSDESKQRVDGTQEITRIKDWVLSISRLSGNLLQAA
jgi:hypothetical protein